MGGTGLEPATSCVSIIFSTYKCLPFLPLCVFLGRQSRLHTGYTIATHYNRSTNTNKTDAKMTPKKLIWLAHNTDFVRNGKYHIKPLTVICRNFFD